MVKIVLQKTEKDRIEKALRKASDREIGGILMGEHIGHNEFKIVDLTVQTKGGTITRFFRSISNALKALNAFFNSTNHDYQRFNYLGEWHSHPKFALTPSECDLRSMFDIVEDNEVGANFAALVIVKLEGDMLRGASWVFEPGNKVVEASLTFE